MSGRMINNKFFTKHRSDQRLVKEKTVKYLKSKVKVIM